MMIGVGVVMQVVFNQAVLVNVVVRNGRLVEMLTTVCGREQQKNMRSVPVKQSVCAGRGE